MKLSKQRLNEIIEEIIVIRDIYKNVMSMEQRDILADACNIIEANINYLSEEEVLDDR